MRGWWGVMAAVAALGTGGVPAIEGAEVAWRELTVRVYDNAGVAKAALRVALGAATDALRPAYLEVTWFMCSTSSGGRCTIQLGRGELMVRLVRGVAQPAAEADETLGPALLDPATGTGVLATVYVDRVERLARGSAGDAGLLLGRAVAHEIGHLLMGRLTHARTGLMRPRWTRAEIARDATADWRLSGPELREIRSRF